jgi:hypothetical protein
MEELFPVALHKAILGVDIEGFADRRRTNPDQILAREGLYCCLREAFARTGIAWDLCYREDRGDGALILVPPEIPKNLLVSRFPQELSIFPQAHNQAHPAGSRIRVRLVVHGGEAATPPDCASRRPARRHRAACGHDRRGRLCRRSGRPVVISGSDDHTVRIWA